MTDVDDDDSAVEVVHHHLIKVSAAADDDALCTVRQKNSDMDRTVRQCILFVQAEREAETCRARH